MREKSLLISILALALVVTGAAGCSGGGDDDGAEIDSGLPQTPDANLGPDAAVGCTIDVGQKMFDGTDTNAISIALLAAGTPPAPDTYVVRYITGDTEGSEWFQFIIDKPFDLGTPIDLTLGYMQNSTYQLVVWGDFFFTGTAPNQTLEGEVYFVTAGTITIDTAGEVGGQFTGSFSDLTLRHMKPAAGGGYEPAGDECDVNIPASTFDLAVEAPSGKPGASKPVAAPRKFLIAR